MSDVIKLNRQWRIGEQLGAGGFARVHEAQSDSGEVAAIKLVPKAAGADRELLFEDLSEVPNIAPIIDRGEWGNFWVIVMPKAEQSLRDCMGAKGVPLPIDDALKVISDVVEALAAIEGQVVHRDIKPDNILLLHGRWCLADFGISRYAEATTAMDTRKFNMTYAYAAPEQWRGERATSATDVYALGVVAYELLAGRRPFAGPKEHDYREQHLEGTPEAIPNVPVPLQTLIDECLLKGPEARPTPHNLRQQLKGHSSVPSEAARRLQQANAVAVKRRTEIERLESVAKSDAERRQELYNDAKQKLDQLGQLLADHIALNASTAKYNAAPHQRSWTLNDAKLSLVSPELVKRGVSDFVDELPFEAVAYSTITVSQPPSKYQVVSYEGRSHSLWFCDAHDVGVFRWYETAFRRTFGGDGALSPFSLSPLERIAAIAIGPALDTRSLARPYTPIDQGAEGEFIERWIGWFADAAQGQLRYPAGMPEGDPRGSYRRNGELHLAP